jgi:hypothetical protein
MSSGDLVWIIEDGVVGEVIRYGAGVSLVRWTSEGIQYEEYLENFEFLEYRIAANEEY